MNRGQFIELLAVGHVRARRRSRHPSIYVQDGQSQEISQEEGVIHIFHQITARFLCFRLWFLRLKRVIKRSLFFSVQDGRAQEVLGRSIAK